MKQNMRTLNRTYVHYRQNRTYSTDRTEHTSIKHNIRIFKQNTVFIQTMHILRIYCPDLPRVP